MKTENITIKAKKKKKTLLSCQSNDATAAASAEHASDRLRNTTLSKFPHVLLLTLGVK